jgi:hypothetical protein
MEKAAKGTPVPGTGKQHWHFGDNYKEPKTTQEKRLSYDLPELIRSKRHARNLTDAWDDRKKSAYGNRSWKRFRNAQHFREKEREGVDGSANAVRS